MMNSGRIPPAALCTVIEMNVVRAERAIYAKRQTAVFPSISEATASLVPMNAAVRMHDTAKYSIIVTQKKMICEI
jgi:hypothetical protein